jgi:hypothetical protein
MEGPKAFSPGMISRGEEQAEVIAYTDNGLQIKTTIKDNVKQTVSRLDETAKKYVAVSGGVRSFLDSIRSGLELPWAMRDLTDAKIIEHLKERTGVSQRIAEIDAELKEKEAQRTETGRDKKRMGEPVPVEKTEHPAPVDDIKAERGKAVEYLKWLEMTLQTAGDCIRSKCHFTDYRQISALAAEVKELADEVAAKFEKGKIYTKADIDAFDAKLAAWYEVERKAAAYDKYIADKNEWDRFTCLYSDLTSDIEELRAKRKKTLADMKLGVKGLEIGEDNLLYHNGNLRGITETNKIGNWSTAESVQVFFQIAVRFSGEMNVLIVDNAESLDESTTGAISKWAEKAEYLVILLKVASVPEDLEDGIIYIREGEVATK